MRESNDNINRKNMVIICISDSFTDEVKINQSKIYFFG